MLPARTTLGVVLVIAASLNGVPATAQSASPPRTTIGALLGGPVDTVEVTSLLGGRLGSSTTHLVLSRARAAFAGRVELSVRVTPRVEIVSAELAPRLDRCDAAFTMFVPTDLVDRLVARIDTTTVEGGAAAPMPQVYDVYNEHVIRLAGARGAVRIEDARTVRRGDAPWYVPQPTPTVPGYWPEHAYTTLVAASDSLARYLLDDRMERLGNACR